MSQDVIGLSTASKAQLRANKKQDAELYKRKFIYREPVADIAALEALEPTEGEQRQVGTGNPFQAYVYNANQAAPEVIPSNAAFTGGWINMFPLSTPEAWLPSFDYVADDWFIFQVDFAATDATGDEIRAGEPYWGHYVDTNGDSVDTTSGTILDAAELLKIELDNGRLKPILVITQAETDADLESILY